MRLVISLLLVMTYLYSQGQQLEQDSVTTPATPVADDLATTTTEASKKKRTFKGPLSMFSGNPGKAALYSLVLPGAGQLYNKKYWKIPMFIAFEGIAIGVLVVNAREHGKWNDYLHIISTDESVTSIDGRNQEQVRDKFNTTRTNRDYAIVGLVAVHLIQVADAFVNRHLIEFDVSEDLSLKLGTLNSGPAFSFNYTF